MQLDIVKPAEQVPAAADALMRMQAGADFEQSIVGDLVDCAFPGWVFATDDPAVTSQAIDDRAAVIANARLANDTIEWRSGAPDMLVWHVDGYVPVDIKHHKTLNDGEGVLVSDLDAPFPAAARAAEYELRANKDDALQLAHYRRMLEGLGVASSERVGGIIGKERLVVWYVLDEPMWMTPAKSDGRKRKKRTTLEAYDFEFGIRRTWAMDAHRHVGDPAVGLLLPVRIGDCGSCGWDAYCNDELSAGSGDVSLLPRVGYTQWRLLREGGVESRADVAGLDHYTATLGASGVDIGTWLKVASAASPAAAVGELNSRAKKQIAVLEAAGVSTAADVIATIDPTTAGFGRVSWLPEAILNARAALGPEPVYLRPGVDPTIPRADIELDIDMENTEDGVYLWGVLVTNRARTGLAEDGYLAFYSYEPLDEEAELGVFGEFWSWLGALSDRAGAAGVSMKSYCWHEAAENTQLRRIARRNEALLTEVEVFIDSGAWVDLERTFKRQWVTGGSTSLKAIAPLAGFAWDVDDPGGGMSMVKYLETVAGDAGAGEWLLTYNEGDVEATLAIRQWLDAGSFETVEVGPWSGVD